MHIPRQPDGPREPRADRRTGHGDAGAPYVRVETVVPGPAPAGATGLRARRQHLVGQLRTVAYWQRLLQARVDLVVAGLLYGAPVAPTTLWTTPLGVGGPSTMAAEDLQALVAPPDGLDVSLLVGHAPHEDGGPGAHLDRLRETSGLLAGRRRLLEEELDAVSLALHDRLASDGAGDGERARGAMAPVVTGPPA